MLILLNSQDYGSHLSKNQFLRNLCVSFFFIEISTFKILHNQKRGGISIIVEVVGNGIGDQSSSPGRYCLRFTSS